MLLITSVSIAREVIVLHKARNTQIVPAEFISPAPGTSIPTVVVETCGSPSQQKCKEDSQGFTNINPGGNGAVVNLTPEEQQQHALEDSETHDGISKQHVEEDVESHDPIFKKRASLVGEAQTETSHKRAKEVQPRDLKAVKVLGVTASVYFIVWGPYVILVVLLSFFPHINVPGLIRFAFIWLANSNSFMNVFIYSLMYSGFRKNATVLFRNTFAHILIWCGIQMQIVKIGDINTNNHTSVAESVNRSAVNSGKFTAHSVM